jgi:hypothetical protein
MLNDNLRIGLLNLHDAFLNASLVLDRMLQEPVEKDPRLFHATNRARFERLWIALLAVLIESWHARNMRSVREYIDSVTDTSDLAELLRQARQTGRNKKMIECRHYMFHRDEREYWDDGRTAPVGELEFHLKLHAAFSKVLLTAVTAANEQRRSQGERSG